MLSNEPALIADKSTNTLLKVLAWGAVLLICLPLIILRQFDPLVPGEPVMPYWLALVNIGILVFIYLAT